MGVRDRLIGGLAGAAAALLPFALALGVTATGIDRGLLAVAEPWVTLGLPIGVVSGVAAGALLGPTVLDSPEIEWWFAGTAALVAAPVGLAIGGAYGFATTGGDLGDKVVAAGFVIAFGLPLVTAAGVGGLAWVAIMRVVADRRGGR